MNLLETGLAGSTARLVLAHGAGAPMTSPFMERIAALLAERGIAAIRFEFGYMAARRSGGKRRPPPKAELLMDEYRAIVREVAQRPGVGPLVIGGKSMGGRVASLVADRLFADNLVAGLVCLGYPFHPPGKPEQLRTRHLETLRCPALIVQGDRDPFGTRAEVSAMQLSSQIRIVWAPDGDHDFGPRGGSGYTKAGNLALTADAVAEFVRSVQ